jgi:hypothetical protein
MEEVEGFGRHRQARLLRSGSVNGKNQVLPRGMLFVRISLIPPKAVLVFKVMFLRYCRRLCQDFTIIEP